MRATARPLRWASGCDRDYDRFRRILSFNSPPHVTQVSEMQLLDPTGEVGVRSPIPAHTRFLQPTAAAPDAGAGVFSESPAAAGL